MPKKRKTLLSKRPADPIGNRPVWSFFCNISHSVYFADDILRQNLSLAKHAKSAEQQSRPLGNFSGGGGMNTCTNYSLSPRCAMGKNSSHR